MGVTRNGSADIEMQRTQPARSKSKADRKSAALRLRLTAAAENYIRAGHPWVFAESVRELSRDGAAGELAVIYDRNDKFLAVGLYDPRSPIRVRVLHTGRPRPIDQAFWQERLEAAVRRREGLFDELTTGYRLINGESDGWPGLVLDRYATTLVWKVYTTAWLARWEATRDLIQARLNPERIVLRLSRNIGPEAARAKLEDGMVVPGNKPEAGQVFLESGLRFEAEVRRGQKTGFFLDQRENRRMVETLARGRAVLNAFSYSGGFSLYAARGGAQSVTDLDISAHALAAAKRNFSLNNNIPAVANCRHELVQADAFEWLAENAGRHFDLIVLDPPSLAKRATERAGAIRAYTRLAQSGMAHLVIGGILVACSCSAQVTADEFFRVVRQAAARSGQKFQELRTTRHAPDHPATFKEAEYLKAIYLRFE